MGNSHPRQLRTLAALQKLRCIASEAAHAEARERHETAQEERSDSERQLVAASAAMDRLFAADSLDLSALRVGQAVLTGAAQFYDVKTEAVRQRADEEAESRSGWKREEHLAAQADALHQRAQRRLSAQRDDQAALEAIELRLALATGRPA